MTAAMNLVCSFSGGETSGLMTRLCLTTWRKRWRKVIVLFANTGEEREECLRFVHRCDQEFGFNVVWLEAVVNPEKGDGTGHRVVTFSSASRNGEPFEAMIRKYGIPNKEWPHCTRELKLNPMKSYLRSIGWDDYIHETAVGIRADEDHRRSKKEGVIHPLLDLLPMTKPEVNEWWMAQPFRLELTGYQGNCKWCWKKSLRKHMTLMDENPSLFDFPERMEAMHGTVGAEIGKPETAYERRVFFRGELSTLDLRSMYEANKDTLDREPDDAIVLPRNGRLFKLDVEPDGCVESCDVDFAEVE